MYKDYPVPVNCPVMQRIETVYFVSFGGEFTFNGCDQANGSSTCKRCREAETLKFKQAHPELPVR